MTGRPYRRVTEFDIFLLLGDVSTTSNVAIGLVRGPRRASDELGPCEQSAGEQGSALDFSSISQVFFRSQRRLGTSSSGVL